MKYSEELLILRTWAVLEGYGIRVDGATIRSNMRDFDLQVAQPLAKVCTTVPAEDLDERMDLLRRDFATSEPGKKLRGDMIYISTWAGFVYLATVLNCCTKKMMGYVMVDRMRTSLVY